MNGIRSRRKLERPGQILEAAFQEFVANGFAATRLDDVARRAGVSKGTIYFYFDNKEKVFEGCVRMIATTSAAEFAEDAPVCTADLAADIYALLARVYRVFDENKRAAEMLRLLLAEANRVPDMVQAYFETFLDPVAERLRLRLAAAAAEGVIAEPSPFLTEMILAPPLARHVMMLLFGKRRVFEVGPFFEAHYQILMQGLMPRAPKARSSSRTVAAPPRK